MEKIIDKNDFANVEDFKEQLNAFKKWCFDNQCIVKQDGTKYYAHKIVFPTLTEEQQKTMLRNKRASLLTAFDKWEKAVLRGRETESIDIMSWYYDILDLNENALNNIPERVKYYL